MSFADRLKELRKQAGLSQQQLAEKSGLHKFGVAKIEQGLREPGWSTVQSIAGALGVDCSAFQDAPISTEGANKGRAKKKK